MLFQILSKFRYIEPCFDIEMTVKMWPDLPQFTLLLLLMETTSVDCSTMETTQMRTQPQKK